MSRCPKHSWYLIRVHHKFEMDMSPGAVNMKFGIKSLNSELDSPVVDAGILIEICNGCGKVRNPK